MISTGIVTVSYIAATILFILALGGLSNQETARRGNWYGITGMSIALIATVLGVVPLLLAFGAGANSRFAIGLTISSGMAVGTLFTLFVLPTFYLILGRSDAKNSELTPKSNKYSEHLALHK